MKAARTLLTALAWAFAGGVDSVAPFEAKLIEEQDVGIRCGLQDTSTFVHIRPHSSTSASTFVRIRPHSATSASTFVHIRPHSSTSVHNQMRVCPSTSRVRICSAELVFIH
eukprot:5403645-Pyramimonas_sp.AAC.1